jgi:hypothetical protein
MTGPPYRSLRFSTRVLTIGCTRRLLMMFAEKLLIVRIFLRPPEGEASTRLPCHFSRDGRHGAHARRALVAQLTQSSTQCGNRGPT